MCNKVISRPVSPTGESKVPLNDFYMQLKKTAFEVQQYKIQNPNVTVFIKNTVERPPMVSGGRASRNMLRTRTRSDTFEDTINATNSKSDLPVGHHF